MDNKAEIKLENAMQHVVHSLINGVPLQAAEALEDIARTWAKAGMLKSSFNDLRQHLIQDAVDKSSMLFIKEKLEAAEAEIRKKRNAKKIYFTEHRSKTKVVSIGKRD